MEAKGSGNKGIPKRDLSLNIKERNSFILFATEPNRSVLWIFV